jgi:hypothetical protein
VSKHLSFAGRLQLIPSVLFSLQVFWSNIFILPKAMIQLLEQKLNQYLWCGKDMNKPRLRSLGRKCVFQRRKEAWG